MKRVILVLTMLAAVVTLSRGAAATGGASQPTLLAGNMTTADYCADSEEQAFLSLINAYRAQNSLPALKLTQTLGAAAENHSVDMATNNYFSHTLFDGTTWDQNIRNFGYTYITSMAENIAAGNSTASTTFTQWQNSAGHNANMLSASYTAIGIGRAYGAGTSYGWYWTTTFGGVQDGGATLCAASPTATATATVAPTKTATIAPTATATPTKTATPLPTATATVAPTKTATPLPTATVAPTKTATIAPTATTTVAPTKTATPLPTATATIAPTKTATPAPTVAPTVSAYVSGLTVASSSPKSGSVTLTFTVTVKDTAGKLAGNSTVSVDVLQPSGAVKTLTGKTSTKGVVSLTLSAKVGSGTYTGTVTNVTASGKPYLPSANAVSSASITV